jgi:hypothetical protein
MSTNKYISGAVALAAVASLAVAVPAFAATTVTGTAQTHAGGRFGGAGMVKPAVVGKVTAISGNTITVSARAFGKTSSATPTASVYTVDATSATITKNNVAGTIASIAVGDTIMVQGTVTGTNVAATTIRDGMTPGRGMMGKPGTTPGGQATPAITGNGQPVVAGAVTAISGSTITITNKSNVTYTIDATSATVNKAGATAALANIAVGDSVVVQGTVNGTNVTASTIIDQAQPASTSGTTGQPSHTGFFGGIGAFFSHLFGF